MTRHRRLTRLLAAAALAVLAVLTFPGTARAQADTPAAREARAALAEVQRVYGWHPGWAPWLRQLALKDIEYELRAGDRAERETLEWTAARLRSGGESAFRWPQFQQLAAALERRSQELAAVPPAEWPAACRREAAAHAPITPEQVQAGRQAIQDRLLALEPLLPPARSPGVDWRSFLRLEQTRSLITDDAPDAQSLDRLATRWHGAPAVWDAPELVEAALAVQAYIPLIRGYVANESADQRAAAWNELAGLLESRAETPPGDVARIAELVNQRERVGQSSTLTASIRREFSQPNIILQARIDWLQSQLSQKIEDQFAINDIYAGARTTGAGRLAATMRCEILPSSAVGQAIFRLEGTSHTNTVGYSEGVRVASHADSRFRGDKLFTLDGRGLSTDPAAASASTSVVFDDISSGGLRRRRNEAVRQTYARRGEIEATASASTWQSITERMNAEGARLVQDFNKSYQLRVRNPQFERQRAAPEVRVRATSDVVQWECRLENPALFALPGPRPQFDPQADVVLSLASSALEEQCTGSLAGRQLTGQELAEAIGELLGEASRSETSAQDFTATFAPRPCEFQFTAGKILARFYITAFDSPDAQYPAMIVDATYNVEEREGDLALVRQGSLAVRSAPSADGTSPAVSGRQQTLRLAVQRKLNKAFAETFTWTSPVLASSEENREGAKLRVRGAKVDGDWLQLSLDRG